MPNKIELRDIDLARFEEKIFVIADEVVNILKELSSKNQKQISSQLIAEKMVSKESVKSVFIMKGEELTANNQENLNSLAVRNNELEDFLKQTMQALAAIEGSLTSEFSSQQKKYKEDRAFDENISHYMKKMKEECNAYNDIKQIKTAVAGKIENISKGFEKKREQDILRLKDTEKTIEDMGKRMNDIKQEAEEIRKRAQDAEFESCHDALTGLYNRRAYEDRIVEVIANLDRYHVQASLLICDIDLFKKINDSFGHKVGDMALKKIAELLVTRLRKNDIISRYGGEEFAVILPHTNLTGAIAAGEGVRSFIANATFSYQDRVIPLTISAGISSFKKGDTPDTVFKRADDALYLAKKSGRNIVKTEKDAATTY